MLPFLAPILLVGATTGASMIGKELIKKVGITVATEVVKEVIKRSIKK